MIFAAPIAGVIAGVIGAIAVVILYMLKLRRRPIPVSSTMLWMSAVRDMEGNVPWQAARPSILVVLHLLIVAVLACAIARPSIGAGAADQKLILLIDTSASMSATIDDAGTTRLDIAKQRAAELVRSMDSGLGAPEIEVYRVGSEPRLVVSSTRDAKKALREIDAIQPTDEPGDLLAVFEQLEGDLALRADPDEASSGMDRVQIVVMTDAGGGAGAPGSIAGFPVGIIVGEDDAGWNIGITAISAQRDRADADLCRVFVRVQSNNPDPTGLILRVLDGGDELGRGAIALDSVEEGVAVGSTTLEVRVPVGTDLEIFFDLEDAMQSDNRAWIWVPDPSPVRFAVIADGPAHPILIDVLDAIAGIAPDVIASDAQIPAWADLVVFDGVGGLDIALPSISFGPAPGVDDEGVHRIQTWKRAHPALRDVSLGSVAFAAPRELDDDSDPGVQVLASGRTDPVMIERVGNGVRRLEIAFDLDRSNWVVQVGFTIFLANAIEYLIPGASGEGVVTRTGIERPRVGVTRMVREGVEYERGVSLLDGQESDTNRAASGSSSDDEIRAASRAVNASLDIQRPLWSWFLAAAFVLVSMEWFLHASRMRIGRA